MPQKAWENQSSGSVSTGRWAWALVAYPILPPSLISRTVSVDVKHHERRSLGESALRSSVRVEVAVLGSPSLIVLTVSTDVK